MLKDINLKEIKMQDKDGFSLYKGNFDLFYKQPFRADYVIFCMVCSGKAKILINLEENTFIRGTEFFLLPNTVVQIQEKTKDFNFVVIAFSPSVFNEASLRINVDEMQNLVEFFPILHKEDDLDTFLNFYSSIDKIFTQKNHSYRKQIMINILQNYLYNLCFITKKGDKKSITIPLSSKDIIFKKFINMVKTDIKAHHSTSYYAEKLFISSRYLLSISQKITGFSPKQLIDKILVLEIKTLLKSSTLSIQEISDKLNFSDQSALSRFFKRQTGISPIAFRNGEQETK